MVLAELKIFEIARAIKFDIILKQNNFQILNSRFPFNQNHKLIAAL